MKKLLLILGFFSALFAASAQERTITLTSAGTLGSFIGDDEKYNVTSLKLSGPINGTDIKLLRDMIGVTGIRDFTDGKLTSLDLSDARIVKGGDAYTLGYSRENIYVDADDEIGRFMFQMCSRLKELKLPTNIKAIGELAFASCEALSTLEIPQGVTKIGRGAFVMAGMKEIVFPESVVEIEDGLFQRMINLERIDLGDGLTEIPNSTFMYSSVKKIRLGKKLTEFDPVVIYTQNTITDFECSEENPKFKCVDGVLFSKDNKTICYYPPARDNDVYTIPEGITEVGDHAFHNAKMLFEVQFPSSIERIGNEAFNACTSLETPNLPKGVKHIGFMSFAECENMAEFYIPAATEYVDGGAFYNATGLENFIIDPENVNFTTRGGALYSKDMKRLVCYPSGIAAGYFSVPVGVEEIAGWAFSGHLSLTEVNVPSTVKSIGEYTFFACPSLKKLVLGENVNKMGEGMIYVSDAMTDVYMLSKELPSDMEPTALLNDGLAANGTLWVPNGTKNMYENSDCYVMHYVVYDEETGEITHEEDIPLFSQIREFNTTGIDTPKTAETKEHKPLRYDLSGRKVSGTSSRQNVIEIVDGKKVLKL